MTDQHDIWKTKCREFWSPHIKYVSNIMEMIKIELGSLKRL